MTSGTVSKTPYQTGRSITCARRYRGWGIFSSLDTMFLFRYLKKKKKMIKINICEGVGGMLSSLDIMFLFRYFFKKKMIKINICEGGFPL